MAKTIIGTALKALTVNGYSPIHGGTEYSLPTFNEETGEWVPGEWHKHEGSVEYSRGGFHVCLEENLPYWRALITRIRPGMLCNTFLVEYKGKVSEGANGFAVRYFRILRPIEALQPPVTLR